MVQEAIPGSRVALGQRTGEILSVESGLLVGSGTSPVLEATHGVTPDAKASALLNFFVKHGAAFGLENPLGELYVPKDELATPPPSSDPAPEFNTVRLVQNHDGVRIHGRDAIGLFDQSGNLLSVVNRVLPTNHDPRYIGLDSPFSPAEAWSSFLHELGTHDLTNGDTRLHWLGLHAAAAEHSEELLFVPQDVQPTADWNFVYQIELRFGLDSARVRMDAMTGEILSVVQTTPSDWWVGGTSVINIGVPNEIGATFNIPGVREGSTVYMGLNSASLGGGVFRAGNLFSIDDSATRPLRGATYLATLSTAAATSWAGDPTYVGGRRAATSLMRNMVTTLNWWKARRWRSWDNRGSTLWTSVGVNKNADGSPDFNAWGGNGVMQFGDGTYTSRETTAASLEVVGHEFMHNVTSATSRLEYAYESGATAEAWADFFGAALTQVGDRFNNAVLGESDTGVGVIRNMSNRRTYYDFVVTDADSGGVHTNSGIFNFAHYIVVNGGALAGTTALARSVRAHGVARVEEILRMADRLRTYAPAATLEEVASGVVGTCHIMAWLRGSETGAGSIGTTCEDLEKAYTDVRIFPSGSHPEIALESAFIRNRTFGTSSDPAAYMTHVRIANLGDTGNLNLRQFSVSVTDSSGSLVPAITQCFTAEGEWSAGVFEPGERLIAQVPLPVTYFEGWPVRADMPGRGAGKRVRFCIEIAPDARGARDTDASNNCVNQSFMSDYTFSGADMFNGTPDGAISTALLRGNLFNNSRLGYAPTLYMPIFTRDASAGAYSELTSAAFLYRELSAAPAATLNSDFAIQVPAVSFRPGVNETTVVLPTIDLTEAASVIPTESTSLGTRYQIFVDANGANAAFTAPQIYALADGTSVATESDETNNFACLNCFVNFTERSGTISKKYGVIVKFSSPTSPEGLFPAAYARAARDLRNASTLILGFSVFEIPRLVEMITPFR